MNTAQAINDSEIATRTKSHAQAACRLIAPVWPLDQFIAVNPWWPQTDLPMADCSARLAARSGGQALMPNSYFRQLWDSKGISEHHLNSAATETKLPNLNISDLLAALNESPQADRLDLFATIIDRHRKSQLGISWQTEVTHQISQFCGAYFDQGQANWRPDRTQSLYSSWLQTSRKDVGIGLLMQTSGIHRKFEQLPETPEALLDLAVDEMALTETSLTAYFHSLLLSINGWASWCAYIEWQAQLKQSPHNEPVLQLLAIRLAWELVLYRYYKGLQWHTDWTNNLNIDNQRIEQHRQQQSLLWVWQRAAELAYQNQLLEKISQHQQKMKPSSADRPNLQAVFCIDVRSEVIRRHLESQNSHIQTLGFAGFFGLPVSYKPNGSHYERPQLPGLLAPAFSISETSDPAKRQPLSFGQTWQHFKQDAPATFTFVESAGLAYMIKLLRNSFNIGHGGQDPLADGGKSEPPIIRHHCDSGQTVSLEEKVKIASGVLRGMNLTRNFAPLVLMVGHGSHSRNNPQRAGLDCGACGGHTGEVNSRALAHLLNEQDVRKGLLDQGIEIPVDTCFIPALHNTTTDAIDLFDEALYQQTYSLNLEAIVPWLEKASASAATERSQKLSPQPQAKTQQSVQERSCDWSQVRPEWGLANNAAFIVAPRSLTRSLDLEGRTFLHDYEAEHDPNFGVLEQIITAPMIVTHWINLQYYASVVDNDRYGSGNKVLHNVVGGNIGLFEGNGGDLRTGLALQSLHNGRDWVHQPLRLSVLIQAPAEVILEIVNRHPHVQQLVDNEWLYLFQIDENETKRLHKNHWNVMKTTATK